MSARKRTAWSTRAGFAVWIAPFDHNGKRTYEVYVGDRVHVEEQIAGYSSRPRALRHAARLRAALKLEGE